MYVQHSHTCGRRWMRRGKGRKWTQMLKIENMMYCYWKFIRYFREREAKERERRLRNHDKALFYVYIFASFYIVILEAVAAAAAIVWWWWWLHCHGYCVVNLSRSLPPPLHSPIFILFVQKHFSHMIILCIQSSIVVSMKSV